MSAVDTKFYDKKKSSTFYIAVLFLLIILAITGGLFFYNSQLQKQNIDLNSQIEQLSSSIKNIQQDSNIQAYSIYEKNQDFLEKLAEQSKIPSFVSHLRKHFAIHGLDSKGFSYSQWWISVELSAQTNESGYAYQKVVKFLRDYNALWEDALFTPRFVAVFDGYDKINFTGDFKLK